MFEIHTDIFPEAENTTTKR